MRHSIILKLRTWFIISLLLGFILLTLGCSEDHNEALDSRYYFAYQSIFSIPALNSQNDNFLRIPVRYVDDYE